MYSTLFYAPRLLRDLHDMRPVEDLFLPDLDQTRQRQKFTSWGMQLIRGFRPSRSFHRLTSIRCNIPLTHSATGFADAKAKSLTNMIPTSALYFNLDVGVGG